MHGSTRRSRVRVLSVILSLIVPIGCGPNPATSPPPSAIATEQAPSSSPSVAPSASPSPTVQPTELAQWTRVTATGAAPTAREGQTWTVDPSSAVAYLFGGRSGTTALNDLWAYDLTSDAWTKLTPKGALPPARSDHIAAWIDGLGVVVAGGSSGTTVLDDLWTYDPDANAWRTLATSGARPPARAEACAAVRTDGRLWLTGGSVGRELLADTWSYDPGTSAWTKLTVSGATPEARAGAVCWWTVDDRLAVYGGRGASTAALGDLWTLQGAGTVGPQWLTGPAVGAQARTRSSAAVAADSILVVGGSGADGAALSDVVSFDAQTLAATTFASGGSAGATPPARAGSSLVNDPEGERQVSFGGRAATGPTAELWSLSLP